MYFVTFDFTTNECITLATNLHRRRYRRREFLFAMVASTRHADIGLPMQREMRMNAAYKPISLR